MLCTFLLTDMLHRFIITQTWNQTDSLVVLYTFLPALAVLCMIHYPFMFMHHSAVLFFAVVPYRGIVGLVSDVLSRTNGITTGVVNGDSLAQVTAGGQK